MCVHVCTGVCVCVCFCVRGSDPHKDTPLVTTPNNKQAHTHKNECADINPSAIKCQLQKSSKSELKFGRAARACLAYEKQSKKFRIPRSPPTPPAFLRLRLMQIDRRKECMK